MKFSYLFLFVSIFLTACLKPLDELDSNPLDDDYQGEYIIIEEVTSRDTNIYGEAQCTPEFFYRLHPDFVKHAKKLNDDNHIVRFTVRTKKKSPDGNLRTEFYSIQHVAKMVEEMSLDELYSYWGAYYEGVEGDSVCPEAYIVSRTYPNQQQPSELLYISPVQELDCFACGQ